MNGELRMVNGSAYSLLTIDHFPEAGQRVFNKIVYKMRVPIENGSGFFNQVSDFTKLPAAYRHGVKISLSDYRISNLPAAVSSSPQNTR